MSIEKVDSVRLKNEKVPYTIHLNYVIQNVKDHLALAIWVYLTSQADNWNVNRTQLMNHFDIGRDKLGNALKYLNENQLIEYIQEKNDEGKFQVSHIVVKCGYEFEQLHKKLSTESDTAPLKNRTTVLPDTGKTAAINKVIYINKQKEKKDAFAFEDQKIRNEPKQRARFWEPGNPDYDRVHSSSQIN